MKNLNLVQLVARVDVFFSFLFLLEALKLKWTEYNVVKIK